MEEINGIEQKVGELDIEEGVRTRILDLINQAHNAEALHNRDVTGVQNNVSALGQSLNNISNRLLQMAATMLVLRGLTSIWRNATSFAQQYYDKLNEIRIVTGRSQDQANQLGNSYRTLARNMKVSATEIAVAATEFWRQGLDEQQVNERLIATTQYAKISSMEFEDAAEVITAATNTMGVSAQHVVDIFAYLGDNSASGPDEVGKAMQKASASAKEFGLTFEWLGAYIATISEATRQAPEVIGTSINSIMARLHSIKEKGFNEEDETKINDIAKALGTIDVALMDNEGNWRSMSDMAEHPNGLHRVTYNGGMGVAASVDENFFTYAQRKSKAGVGIFASKEAKEEARESMAFWSGVVEELQNLGIDATSAVEVIDNKMLEFDIAAASVMDANRQSLADAW